MTIFLMKKWRPLSAIVQKGFCVYIYIYRLIFVHSLFKDLIGKIDAIVINKTFYHLTYSMIEHSDVSANVSVTEDVSENYWFIAEFLG